MNEKNHKPDDQLEGMLRRWGADEAAGQAGAGPMPVMPQRRRTILLRWGPPAAAAAMLAAAVGLFLAARSYDGKPAAAQESLKAELARTRKQLSRARNELAAARQNYDSQLVKLKATFQQEKEKLVDETGRTIAALEKNATEKEVLLKQAGDGRKQAENRLAAEQKRLIELAGKHDLVRSKLAAAVSELARREQAYQRAVADKRKTGIELSALKADRDALLADFQYVYLIAASKLGSPVMAPGCQINSLELRRMAASGVQLRQRCTKLRPFVPSASTGRLMDRAEVVLTRLRLLNSTDAAEAEAFAALVRSGGLVREIDEVLAANQDDVDVRAWLLEARLILAGAENVG